MASCPSRSRFHLPDQPGFSDSRTMLPANRTHYPHTKLGAFLGSLDNNRLAKVRLFLILTKVFSLFLHTYATFFVILHRFN